LGRPISKIRSRGIRTLRAPQRYGFWAAYGDDKESLLPSRAEPPGDYPEELIEKPETRARMSTFQRDELLTQNKILDKGDFAAHERGGPA
jgi:hypothetical protein